MIFVSVDDCACKSKTLRPGFYYQNTPTPHQTNSAPREGGTYIINSLVLDTTIGVMLYNELGKYSHNSLCPR